MALQEVKEWPPNIDQIRAVFPIVEGKTIFAYGDKIYNPDGGEIDTPLLAHEAMHSIQQEKEGGPEIWWHRYLVEPDFRRDQEAEAYAEQYKVFCMLYRDRNTQAKFLYDLAGGFSSELYGKIVTFNQAIKLIKNAN